MYQLIEPAQNSLSRFCYFYYHCCCCYHCYFTNEETEAPRVWVLFVLWQSQELWQPHRGTQARFHYFPSSISSCWPFTYHYFLMRAKPLSKMTQNVMSIILWFSSNIFYDGRRSKFFCVSFWIERSYRKWTQ